MKLKNKILSFGAIALAGVSLSSCSDFLEIKSLNDIVLENFWNEKSDVDNVIAGCYSAMQTSSFIDRCMIWGEGRSDDMIGGTNIDNVSSLKNIFKENLNANNEFTTWTAFYNVINRCNTILQYAPSVTEKDPNYTESDLQATQAEASALRDLCYFYLIRTFRDVPYYTYAFTDDNQDMQLPATKFDVVLDSLISDLESVQNKALEVYPETETYYNRGRITRDAIHAMLADMYLWKEDYTNCVKYADMVIDSKLDTYKENEKSASNSSSIDKLVNGYPLISDAMTSSNYYGKASTAIFGSGNSSESIFELIFMDNSSMLSNWSVSYRYGNATTNPGYIKAADFIGSDVSDATYAVFHNKYDTRYYENMQNFGGTSFGISKYVNRSAYVDLTSSTTKTDYGATYSKDLCHANWIMYRLSDVMLMKAEALTQLVNSTDTTGAYSSYNDSTLREAFNIVNAVNKRSYGSSNYADTLKYTSYNTKLLMTNLILDERQRELMFEGKRWYDLVRRSRRDGNTTYLIEKVLRKYTENTSAVQSKLTKMDGIYWPYNEDELKVNTNLTQNSAFGSGDDDSYEVSK